MDVLFHWLNTLVFKDLLYYGLIIVLFDLIGICIILKNKSIRTDSLSMNYWLPLGVLVPLLWLLSLETILKVELFSVVGMMIFYGVIRPYLHELIKKK
jgi:hypothetical protein